MLLSPVSIAGRTSRVLLADVILWINKASLALFISRVIPTTNLKFGSCTVLSTLSPLIEASKFEVEESVSDSISAIEAPTSMWLRLCTHYIDDLLPYEPLELCCYWGCGQVFHLKINDRVYANEMQDLISARKLVF